MSFYMDPPAFLANDPQWCAKYADERAAMDAAYARAGEFGAAVRELRKKAGEERAARLAGKKAESEETWSERIAVAEQRAAVTQTTAEAVAQVYYKKWASDSDALAVHSRAALSKCVEAGRAAVASYDQAFKSYEFAIQRLNMDGAYTGVVLTSVLTGGGRGLNISTQVDHTLKYLTDSTEALAKAIELLESGAIVRAAQVAEAEAKAANRRSHF